MVASPRAGRMGRATRRLRRVILRPRAIQARGARVMHLIYRGSVKNLYEAEDPAQLWFEYTDDYSVFDWGKMPDAIRGKGEALAGLAEFFFNALADPARWRQLGLHEHARARRILPLHHHFLERQGRRIRVLRVDVPRLGHAQVGGVLVYDYGYARAPTQLIPLEVIFRFGVPKGSSLLKRKDWYPFPIHEGAEFDEPLIEFSTKLERGDRMLTYQEAVHLVQGGSQGLSLIHDATYAVASFLDRLFAQRGLKLWDGKVEWAWIDGRLSLVDSIGPDELRVGLGETVFSKQFLRDFYLGTPWYQAVEEAKQAAKARGTAEWKRIVTEELRAEPGPLSPAYREAAEALYADFFQIVVNNRPSSRFTDALKRL
jgi:phosphoribosylaminoimidazole-succinocarboxamide synthase